MATELIEGFIDEGSLEVDDHGSVKISKKRPGQQQAPQFPPSGQPGDRTIPAGLNPSQQQNLQVEGIDDDELEEFD